MSQPTAVYDPIHGWVHPGEAEPAEPTEQAGPQLMGEGESPAPENQPTSPKSTTDARAMEGMSQTILEMGGVKCPYCQYAFMPPASHRPVASSAPPDADPAPHVVEVEPPIERGPPAFEPAVHADLPVEDDLSDDDGDDGEVHELTDEEDAGSTEGDDDEMTASDKVAILRRIEHADGLEHQDQIIRETGIPREVLMDWMGKWKAGELLEDTL